MFKKTIVFLTAVAVFTAASFCCSDAVSAPEVSAESAVLYCADSGEILFQKNANEKMSIASTTKIMTALIACESGRLADEITVTKEMVSVEGTSMGLLPGDKVTVRGLIYGMLLASGNDAANTVAIALAGSLENFAVLMNSKADALGMSNTNFVNPSGLTDENHYSTCRDMALLAAYALKNDVFSTVCASKNAALYYGNPPYRRVLSNHNKLLSVYDGANGVKTGFTKAAGRCLVSSAQRNGVTLIAVTLNDGNDWEDHTQMLDYGFMQCMSESRSFRLTDISVPVVGGDIGSVNAVCDSDYSVCGNDIDDDLISYKICKAPFVYAPVKKDTTIGFVSIFYNNIEICNIPLTASADVGAAPKEEKKKFSVRFREILEGIFRH